MSEMNVVRFPGNNQNQVGGRDDEQKRWCAELIYKDFNGGGSWNCVTFEEISELHDIIEQGPDWNTLVSCTIRLAALKP